MKHLRILFTVVALSVVSCSCSSSKVRKGIDAPPEIAGRMHTALSEAHRIVSRHVRVAPFNPEKDYAKVVLVQPEGYLSDGRPYLKKLDNGYRAGMTIGHTVTVPHGVWDSTLLCEATHLFLNLRGLHAESAQHDPRFF